MILPRIGPRPDVAPQASIQGTLLRESNCLYLDIGDSLRLLAFYDGPINGTFDDTRGVLTVEGKSLSLGQRAAVSGGELGTTPDQATSCRPAPAFVAAGLSN